MTGYWLLDNPNPAAPERGDGRYWGYAEMQGEPIWVTVHTSESFLDAIAPDTGAENVAAYFTRIDDPEKAASYHTLVDSDSTVDCLPAGLDGTVAHTAFHCWRRNSRNLGLSFAMRAAEWPAVPSWWRTGALDRGAQVAARWCNRWGIPIVLRTLAEVDAGMPGITGHGIIQPADRTDPGALFPWDDFLDRVRRAASGGHNEGDDDDMPSLLCKIEGDKSGAIFGCFAGIWRPLSGPEFGKWGAKVEMITHNAVEWDTLRKWGRVA